MIYYGHKFEMFLDGICQNMLVFDCVSIVHTKKYD